ncbi:MAG: hypothetical protein O7D29_08105 [Gemmatimonadetes bacterium]|nr:hypothetical protein [Gemmatimonadota bacterium]
MSEPLDPEYFDDFDDDDEDGEIDDGTSVAIVATQETITVRVEEVKDDRTPDGMACMATFLGDRMIARAVVPPEAIIDLQQREVLKLPVQLGLAAVEDKPGLQCRLFALVPATVMDEPDEADEPWAASVPRFEDLERPELPKGAMIPLLLGHIVRFDTDRKHPDDLAAEAADVLRKIMSTEAPLKNVVDKVLEDLLGGSSGLGGGSEFKEKN